MKLNSRQLWARSREFREVADAALAKFNATRHLRPKCGAKRRTDGQPCQNLPLANGRCRLHGGRVPGGDGWHKPRWPENGPGADAALARKLEHLEWRRAKRAARLAAMTPEERARHEAWHRARKPGSAAERAAERERRRQDKAAANLLGGDRPRERRSPELLALDAEIVELRLALAIETGEGIFR
ncbi:HGGxSTG domain-containing protein [Blastochloris tepida]|uniref:HGGxSTG domain-containing protein n=1 Tax=Blastochloris tepida TaxID=2233851 RepID=UPI000F826903|nr:HGGxSTG domain-containing protein [Blastochloris tepida]